MRTTNKHFIFTAVGTAAATFGLSLAITGAEASGPEDPVASGSLTIGTEANEVLADGRVTRAEYDRTVDAVIDCINVNGRLIGPSDVDRSGLTTRVTADNFTDSDLIRADQCYEEVGQAVDIAYQTQPDVQQQRDATDQSIVDCYSERGMDLRDLAGSAWAADPISEYVEFDYESLDAEALVSLVGVGAYIESSGKYKTAVLECNR